MLPRYRRRRFGVYADEQQPSSSRLLLRALAAVAVLAVVWYLVSHILALIAGGSGRDATALLSVRAGGVQVSLQGEGWQPAETGLRMTTGDSIETRSDGDATIQFFDGTKLRLAGGARITIDKSDRSLDATSAVSVHLENGKIWIATPAMTVFTGAILRQASTESMELSIPTNAQLLVTRDLIAVVQADGPGVTATIDTLGAHATVIVGEGQRYALINATKEILDSDPYRLRDPLAQDERVDSFIAGSYALLSGSTTPGTDDASDAASATTPSADLEVRTPTDNGTVDTTTVRVSGTTSSRVATLIINGKSVGRDSNGSFSIDVSADPDRETTITIEAQDAQGITIAKSLRNIRSTYQVKVEPVRIKSPVGSGETLSTQATDVEITGEAPQGTEGIIVNDYRLQLYKPGNKTWSYLASVANGNLVPGKNMYTIVALDKDGRKSPGRSITIDYSPAVTGGSGAIKNEQPIKQNAPLEPGSLSVTSPTAGTSGETKDIELSILGTTSPNTASISVNGYILSMYESGSTQWKYIASVNLGTMKRGRNLYRIVARNAKGEILDVLEYSLTLAP